MKNLLLTGLTLLTPILCLASHGADGSGGGSQIENAFRIRASELANEIAFSPQANSLCSADLVFSALKNTKIQVVDQLVDLDTGNPVTNLDAWTNPGTIQLKNSSWTGFENSSHTYEGRNVDGLILHEVFRATAGKCLDDNFVLSNQAVALLNRITVKSCDRTAIAASARFAQLDYGTDPMAAIKSTGVLLDMEDHGIDTVTLSTQSGATHVYTFRTYYVASHDPRIDGPGDCLVSPPKERDF